MRAMGIKGQADFGVGGLVALLILIAIGALVVYSVTPTATELGVTQRSKYNFATTNSAIDNAEAVGWENVIEGTVIIVGTENITATDWVLYTKTTDNTGLIENTIWFTRVNVDFWDGVESARFFFEHALADNTGIGTVNLKAFLRNPDGADTLIWESSPTATYALTAQENDIKALITKSGEYQIRLRAETTSTVVATVSLKAQWDDAGIETTTYGKSYLENVTANVESKGSTVFNLLTILAIVIVAALIIATVMRAIGGAAAGPGAPGAPALFRRQR